MEEYLDLHTLDDKGETKYMKWNAVKKLTGFHNECLDGGVPPQGCEQVWQDFWELCRGRTNNGMTYNPLDLNAIKVYYEIHGTVVTPLELKLLYAMDGTYLKATSKTD